MDESGPHQDANAPYVYTYKDTISHSLSSLSFTVVRWNVPPSEYIRLSEEEYEKHMVAPIDTVTLGEEIEEKIEKERKKAGICAIYGRQSKRKQDDDFVYIQWKLYEFECIRTTTEYVEIFSDWGDCSIE